MEVRTLKMCPENVDDRKKRKYSDRGEIP